MVFGDFIPTFGQFLQFKHFFPLFEIFTSGLPHPLTLFLLFDFGTHRDCLEVSILRNVNVFPQIGDLLRRQEIQEFLGKE